MDRTDDCSSSYRDRRASFAGDYIKNLFAFAPRSAIIVFRFVFNFGEVSHQASYAHPPGRRFAVLASLEGSLRSFGRPFAPLRLFRPSVSIASVLRFAYAHRLAAPSGDCFRNRVPSESFAFCGASHGLGCPPRASLASWRRFHRNRPSWRAVSAGRRPLCEAKALAQCRL